MQLKIIALLKEILEELVAIRTALHTSSIQQLPIPEELMDSCDAKFMLKICDRTLYRWRKEKLIKSQLIGKKHYYAKADLIRLNGNK